MTDYIAWERLCTLIDDDPEIWPSVQEVLHVGADDDREEDDGDDHQADTDESGVEEDDGADEAWGALIDALDDCGALAYLHADDTAMELADALAGVPRVVRIGLDTDEIGDVDGDVPTASAAADALLAPAGLALVFLEEDSDAYPLVVVPRESVTEIVDTAAALGFVARQLS
ncbi:hypothetical protein HDC34_001162 [Pseudoclavibacter sp. JAI123]|uniref:DUF6630 family protein n=1 Tax=Pseudoclavibacter sp. JAI123 TaxID=2723065 RepID=UPI0015CEB130|nr:hypothetical protein [Pseudoclavibacter sp. JAI123]NYF12868.1 hypothetical protein [Pseudoclavibacter sp. JAI123]